MSEIDKAEKTPVYFLSDLFVFSCFQTSEPFPSTSASTAEFSGVLSPLEPLDPNKFRNIMLDKQDVLVKQEITIKQEMPSNAVNFICVLFLLNTSPHRKLLLNGFRFCYLRF